METDVESSGERAEARRVKTNAITNNIFWMRHIFCASKARIFLNILMTIIQAVFNFIFDVYIFLIVLDGWQNGDGF